MAFIARGESRASVWPLCYIAARFLQMWRKQKVDSDMDLGFITVSTQGLEPWGKPR